MGLRPKRMLRSIRLNHVFMVVFAACLFIFWFTGFRHRPYDEFEKAPPIAPTGTGWWFSKKQLKKDLKPITAQQHPIPQLMEDAQRQFGDKLARQSTTLGEAVIEYRRRYNREPPKGFDDWWDFAKSFNVQMVDEYDILMEDLAPFYELSGVEIRRRVEQVCLFLVVPL
jgi:hypothetical protein